MRLNVLPDKIALDRLGYLTVIACLALAATIVVARAVSGTGHIGAAVVTARGTPVVCIARALPCCVVAVDVG